ncbi:insulinase family protein [Aliiglaciecola sp. CAU 1673]|uniref:insulinase family protein n=1 Tax=Aliiglaciecola sp. CAU 1673 TaxID=3032595 RepID=UPI0023DB33AC|nr:insulinase family protein [Aliiglaciecola sp. CAU 1673]MDF2177127.1 insulinase family protein [Aliiglaciecola sp. CAU 1673]
MIRSTYDKCQYRLLTLNNGLKLLLVQDPDCTKSAASITVNAGHFQDPKHCQGLGHLLEHMLFLGCKDFPQPNHLADFLANHGGHVNAWTGTETSSFYFDVFTAAFEQALTHFSAMLRAPLFDPALISKEVQAIDAEFKLKRSDDLRRLYQVHKETCNPDHPFSKFSVGNIEIFEQFSAGRLQEMLQESFCRYMGASNMTACLVSEADLDALEALARDKLEAIPRGTALTPEKNPALYLPHQLGTLIKIVPLKSAKRLIVTFALPDIQPYFKSKPLNMISHLIGDEGEGSLLSYLKQKGWVTSLSAGGGIQGRNFKDFNVSMQLTDAGAEHVEEILESLFCCLELIKQKGIEQWRFEERQKFGQLAFDFHDKPKPIELANHLSGQLLDYPDEYLLCGEYLVQEFSPEGVRHLLSMMSPLNMRVKLILPEQDTEHLAKWYDAPYSISPLNGNLLKRLLNPGKIKALQLPTANPYLGVSTLPQPLQGHYAIPRKILEEPGFTFWFGQDHQFRQPKGELYLSFDSKAVEQGVEVACYKRIWTNMVQEVLSQEYYQALIAGLNFHFYAHQGGFSLHTSGFSEKQFELASDMLERVLHFSFTEKQFEQAKQKQIQALRNSLLNKPINRLFTRLSVLLQPLSHAPLEMLPVVESADYGSMKIYQQQLLLSLHLEAFAYGDWPLDYVTPFVKKLSAFQPVETRLKDAIPRQVLDYRGDKNYLHQVPSHHEDSALLLYFQAPDTTVRSIASCILTEQLLAAPFFNQLRTEKQLGYLVGSGYMPYNQHPGLGFYLQSPNASASMLQDALFDFLQHSQQMLAALPEQTWQSVKQSIAKQLLAKDTSLSMRSQRLWLAIGNRDWQFDQQQRLCEEVMSLYPQDILNFCQKMLKEHNFGELLLVSDEKDNLPADGSRLEILDLITFKSKAKILT